MKTKTTRAIGALLTLPVCLATFLFGQRKDEEEVFELSPFEISSVGYGVTPGGAQDIAFTRSQIAAGKIPQPSTFTAEGLLSEYDLPLNAPKDCDNLICVYGEAMPAHFPDLPEASYLAQIGFASGIDAATWERAPINLIAVIDKSGSMSGRPLTLVRQSLLKVLDQLSARDQLSIVLYGDRSHVYLEPISTSSNNKQRIRNAILEIESSGSTNMENGLRVGYDLADLSAPDFEGNTRLMLFTDERPNTGNTSEAGFMRQMRDGSNKGYGLTTIGVGTHFGAELANSISSVRGGNLFFFPDATSMEEKFANEFETMVTELAYDMTLSLSPAKGFKIAGVYGIPGDMLKWSEDGHSLYIKVETLFLSLRKGAIYFALAPDSSTFSSKKLKEIAQASLSYQMSNQKFPISQKVSLTLRARSEASLGLIRGEALIDEYISLKKATTLHHESGNSEKALQIVQDLSQRFENLNDPDIKPERQLITEIAQNLAILTKSEISLFEDSNNSPLNGTWIANLADNPEIGSPALVRFHSNRLLEISQLDESREPVYESFAIMSESFGKRRHGQLRLLDEYAANRLAASSRTINELTNSADYLDGVSRIIYKVRGNFLTLSLYDEYNNQDNYIVLQRQSADTQLGSSDQKVEIDPKTGLPRRS